VDATRTTGKIIGSSKTTFIALIPKEDNLTSFEKNRLIFLCNCIYKIISKLVARRLKGYYQHSRVHFGFLEGIQFHEAFGYNRKAYT